MANRQISADPITANLNARQMLLQGSPREIKKLGTFNAAAGQTTRVKLYNVGILTKLTFAITASLTIGTAVATASVKAPYNLISRVRVTDYDNADHVNVSGFQLFCINSVREKKLHYFNNNGASTAAFTNPSVPTAIGAASVTYFVDVPIAYDVDNPVTQLQDTRGAVLMQTATGDMYLTIDWMTSLYTNGDVDALYSGSGTTTVTGAGSYISCDVYQHFILPQTDALPMIDLNTVYELSGNVRSSDNLAVNNEKQIAVPNVRSIIGAYFNYVQATTMTQGKLTTLRMIVNGNNVLMEESETMRLAQMRRWLGGDLAPGAYFYTFRERPVETAIFGNVMFGLTPNTVGATPYVEVGWESFYTKGVTLSAVPQSSI